MRKNIAEVRQNQEGRAAGIASGVESESVAAALESIVCLTYAAVFPVTYSTKSIELMNIKSPKWIE
ncbi:MAG: hypothetical protein AB7U29_00775 [Desulfobulbus sp.]